MLNSHICKLQIGIEQGSECVDSDVGTHSHRNIPQRNDNIQYGLDAFTVLHFHFHWAIISNRFEPEPSCLSLKRHHISFTQFVKGMNTISYNICIIIYTVQSKHPLYNIYTIYTIYFYIFELKTAV